MNVGDGRILKKFSYSPKLGYGLIIISSALYALTHVIGKPLLTTPEGIIEINPIALAATIYIINGLFFTPFTKNSAPVEKIGKKNLILIVFVGIAEVSALITYFFGLKDSTAINASIFSNGEIIFSLLIAITIFRERIRKYEFSPIFLIIFGMMILPVSYDLYQEGFVFSELVFGDMLIILSGLLYAVDVNICKFVSDRISSQRITQILSFSAGGFALALLIGFQLPYEITLDNLFSVSLIAILGTGLATLFFLIALRLIGAVKTILIYSSTSVFGLIFSGIFLSEQITIVNLISIGTVLTGIFLLRKRLGKDDHIENNDLVIESYPICSDQNFIFQAKRKLAKSLTKIF